MFRKLKEIQGHSGAIYSCTYDGKYLYSGSADTFVARWNLETGNQDKFAIKFEVPVYCIESYDSILIVGLSNGALHVFDTDQRVELKHFTQHKEAIFSIQKNLYRNQIYVGDAASNLSVWNAETFELIICLPLDSGKIRDIAVSDDGDSFVVACQDGTVRKFDTDYFNEVLTINAHANGATSVIFYKDQLVTGGKDAMLRLWNEDGRILKEIPAHNFAIYRLLKTRDFVISLSRDKTIKVWSPDLDFIQRLDIKEGGHRYSVNDGVILDTDFFASCGDDKRLIIWGI